MTQQNRIAAHSAPASKVQESFDDTIVMPGAGTARGRGNGHDDQAWSGPQEAADGLDDQDIDGGVEGAPGGQDEEVDGLADAPLDVACDAAEEEDALDALDAAVSNSHRPPPSFDRDLHLKTATARGCACRPGEVRVTIGANYEGALAVKAFHITADGIEQKKSPAFPTRASLASVYSLGSQAEELDPQPAQRGDAEA